jgi:hypothetical protein
MHSIVEWSEAPYSEAEIEKIRRFSNPATNPFDRDPRSEAQIAAYKRKEEGRAKIIADYRQFEKYRAQGIGPKSFQTFLKHKLADDEKYKAWMEAYRQLGK